MTYNQVNALAYIIRFMKNIVFDHLELNELYYKIDHIISSKGLDELYSYSFVTKRFLEMPRKYEIVMALNRIKNLNIITKKI